MLPDENSKRFIAVLNKKVETGKLMNALGHMTVGLASGILDKDDICLLDYKDKEDNLQAKLSHYPFIVLKADNSNKVRTVREEAVSRDIPFVTFTSSMTIGASEEQINATAETPESELEYFGILLFGNTAELKEFTGKFSLYV